MRCPAIFAKSAALFFVLCVSAPPARAQNQTPANIPFVGWTDPDTGLMWTKQDNGTNVNWNQAIAYCSNLRLGGYTDWRLPTIDELQAIYDANAGDQHVKGNLKLSPNYWHWSSSQASAPGKAWYFQFSSGSRNSYRIGDSGGDRALCVRH